MSSDILRRNDATRIQDNTLNGQTAQIAITVHGSDFYFAICAVMGFTAFAVLGASFMKPRQDRIFFYITAAINATAAIAYFTMGSNLGWAPIAVEFVRSDPEVRGLYREVFYARYVDWFMTTPLLLLDLLLTAGLPWPTILWTIFLDWVMIITGLIGALVASRYKFGFYAIGCAAMFGIFYELAINGRRHAKALGNDVNKVFTMCGVLTLVVWLCYPIAWGVCEGGNVIAPDSEAVFYGVLDVIAKPVFSAALIFGHWDISPGRLGLTIREYPFEDHDQHNEKSGRPHTGVDNTAGYSTGYSPNTGTGHAGHTTGYTPGHEGATTEGAPHTAV